MLLNVIPHMRNANYKKLHNNEMWQWLEGDLSQNEFTVNENLGLKIPEEYAPPLHLYYEQSDMNAVAEAIIKQLKLDSPSNYYFLNCMLFAVILTV